MAPFRLLHRLPLRAVRPACGKVLVVCACVLAAGLHSPQAQTLTSHRQSEGSVSTTAGATNILAAGQRLNSLTSSDGRFRFVYQNDGNVVLYQGSLPLWASGTHAPGSAIMQSDGNFVVSTLTGTPLWATNTSGYPGAFLVVQNDGNVVIYAASGTPLWATRTGSGGGPPSPPPSILTSGQSLSSLASADGRFRLVYQGDGNIVLYRGVTPLWASGTSGPGHAVMQGDGNFVVYTREGTPVRWTSTWGHPGAFLVLQNDGNAVIYAPDGTNLWSTGTSENSGPPDQTARFTATCTAIWQIELGRAIDPTGLGVCLSRLREGQSAEQITAWLREQPEWIARQPGESGRLTLNRDNHIVTETGRKWRGIGASDFLLFQRFTRAEDVTPILRQRRALGFNYLRVFGMFDGALGRFRVGEVPNYTAQLDQFLMLAASHGLRVEFVVFADAQLAMPDRNQQRAHLLTVAQVLNRHANTLGELANEYQQNGVDPQAFSKPPGPTLWSRGSNCCGNDGYFDPPWDYITHHPARDDQWPRKAECRPIRDASGRDCLEDEPIGASAIAQPGRRSNSVVDFGQAGAAYGLLTSGGLFHSDNGILSQPFGEVERTLAQVFVKGLTFAPVEAITAPYQRGDNCGDCSGIGNMPLEQLDARELRAFCKAVDGVEYCVVVRGDGPPRPRAGWRIVETVLPGVVRLSRSF